MAPIIGFGFLLLTFSIAIFVPFFNFLNYKKASENKIFEINLALTLAIFLSAIFSQISLIYSFLISDYSVSNVYNNSHHLKPLIYKISGSWGNHEGSMLLLVTILCAYSLAFALFSKFDKKLKIITISSQSFIIASFAAFSAITSNPFARIFPVPKSGLGLNPILQDIGLALHPPMLYTGYIGFSIIFSITIAGLLAEKIDRDFAKKIKNWLYFAFAFLTLGIGLGAWWAYRELGWGGYWFWDPVENISLMPWIASCILIHSLRSLEIHENFKIWNSLMAIITFILCLLGIFLVRSGILTSVHSFAIDAGRGFFVILLILLIGGSGLLIFGQKIGKIIEDNQKPKNYHFFSKIGLILVNNYFLSIALFIVLLGTIYPIFSRSIFNQFIVIGPEYYNKIFTILIIPFLTFFAISGELKNFKKGFKTHSVKKIIINLILALSLTIFCKIYYQKIEFSQILILFLAFFSIFQFFPNLKNLKSSQSSNVMTLSHFGFSLIIAGIIFTSSLDVTKKINIRIGESFDIDNYQIEFEKLSYKHGKNYIVRAGNFKVSKNKQGLTTLNPENRYYPIVSQNTYETSIKHSIFGDLYLVIGNIDEQENFALRAYYKPFIWLIWFGCLLIFSSSFFAIFSRFKLHKPKFTNIANE